MSNLINTWGFENGTLGGFTFGLASGGTIDSTSKITGVYSFKADYTTGNEWFTDMLTLDEQYMHFRFNTDDITQLDSLVKGYNLTFLWNCWMVGVASSGGSRYLQTTTYNNGGGGAETTLGSTALSSNTTYRLEVHYKRTTGLLEVKLNGVAEVSDTHSTGSSPQVTHTLWGNVGGANPTCNCWFDDVWHNQASGGWPGNLTFIARVPGALAASAQNQWTGVGDTTNKYLNWDEIPYNDTDYNTATGFKFQCHALDSVVATGFRIRAVSLGSVVKYVTTPPTCSSYMREGTTNGVASMGSVATTYGSKVQHRENYFPENPTGPGSPQSRTWTNAIISSLQIGNVNSAGDILTTQLVLQIVHDDVLEAPVSKNTEVFQAVKRASYF